MAVAGENVWTQEELRRVSGSLRTPRLNGDLEVSLSEREGEVLRQMAFGLTNKQIAADAAHQLRDRQGARPAHSPQDRSDRSHAGGGVGGAQGTGLSVNGHDAKLPAPEDDFELPIGGFQGTPEEIERQWFEQVYKGRGDSMAQLTWRAVIMGSLLGSVLSLTNLYIGLKSGWGFGVAITACILSYALWTGLFRIGLVGSQMTILENNCMQSAASSAGYSTGGTLISAFSAYMMLNPDNPLPLRLMLGWVFFLAVLGVTMAIPMKRQMINVEQLRFPSGIAAAETLRALHSHGEKGTARGKGAGDRRRPGRRQPVLERRLANRDSCEALDAVLPGRCARASDSTRRSSARTWMDRTVSLRLGPDFHCGRRPDGHAGFGQHVAWAARFAGPCSCRSCSIKASFPVDLDPRPHSRNWCYGRSGAAFPA